MNGTRTNDGELNSEQVFAARETLERTADFFKMFSDPTRLRITTELLSGEMCVCALARRTDVSQSAVSHQLRLLKAACAVKTRREGKQVYYSLDDAHVEELLRTALEHMAHSKTQAAQ